MIHISDTEMRSVRSDMPSDQSSLPIPITSTITPPRNSNSNSGHGSYSDDTYACQRPNTCKFRLTLGSVSIQRSNCCFVSCTWSHYSITILVGSINRTLCIHWSGCGARMPPPTICPPFTIWVVWLWLSCHLHRYLHTRGILLHMLNNYHIENNRRNRYCCSCGD